jgi:hypothetical protein
MMKKIQNSPQIVTIIFTLLAFWNGWKEVNLALSAIRFLPLIPNFPSYILDICKDMI